MSEPAASSASPLSSTATETKAATKRPKARGTRVIAIANQKGGVGKSTTAVSLGAALAENGHPTLVIDLDPQGNASTGMGIRHEARAITVYDVLASDAPLEDSVIPTAVDGLSAVPSTIDLAGAEIELVSQFSREAKLKKAIEPLRQSQAYEFIILDCPPSLGLLTVNALTAAEELIVPIQCEYYALEGLGQLLRNVGLVQQNINPQLRLSGIVMTMFDPRTKLSEQVVEEVQKYFGDLVYDVIIPRTVRLSEAPGYGQPITVYDPKSKGAQSYRRLADEVASRAVPGGPMPSFNDLPSVILPPVVEAPSDPEPDPEPEPETVGPPTSEVDAAPPPEPATAKAEAVPPPPRTEPPKQAAPRKPAAARPAASASSPSAAGKLPSAAARSSPKPVPTKAPARPHPEPDVAELDEDLFDQDRQKRTAPPSEAPAGTTPRVVVIDEDADRGRIPEHAGKPGSGIGATLEEEGKRPRRWRLFRKGGE
ncbi:MAG TPA: AAA family ATPase [Actinomycetota bacterium]